MSTGCTGRGWLGATSLCHKAALAQRGGHCGVPGTLCGVTAGCMAGPGPGQPQGTRPRCSSGEMLFLFAFLDFRLRNCAMLWKSAKVLIRQRISKQGKKGWQAGTRDKMANL